MGYPKGKPRGKMSPEHKAAIVASWTPQRRAARTAKMKEGVVPWAYKKGVSKGPMTEKHKAALSASARERGRATSGERKTKGAPRAK